MNFVECWNDHNLSYTPKSPTTSVYVIGLFGVTRSYAALQAADLEWIVGPGYSLGGYILEKNHEKPTWNHEKT